MFTFIQQFQNKTNKLIPGPIPLSIPKGYHAVAFRDMGKYVGYYLLFNLYTE